MSSNAKPDGSPGAPSLGGPASEPASAPPSAATQPIRVVLEKGSSESKAATDESSDAPPTRVSPQTGLVLGLTVLAAMLFCAQATVGLSLLACLLVLLHRDLIHPEKPLEAYAQLVPQRVEKLFQHLRQPDGRSVLVLFLLAVALVLVPRIAIGAVGAAALLTALSLLNWLDQPAETLMGWFADREESWREGLGPRLGPSWALALAAVSLAPPLHYLFGALLPARLPQGLRFPTALAAGSVLLLLAFLFLIQNQLGRAGAPRPSSVESQTLFLANVALSLTLCALSVQMGQDLGLVALPKQPLWLGLGLAVFPVGALWTWWRGYRTRSSQGESATWRYACVPAALTAVLSVVAGYTRDLKPAPLGSLASGVWFLVVLGGWFVGARLLIGLVRSRPGGPVPEWTIVFLAVILSMMLCHFLMRLGEAWGLVLSVYPLILLWREAARVLRQFYLQAPGAG
jgi:hypothetical protein